MNSKKTNRMIAKQLVSISLDEDGLVNDDRVRAVIDTVRKQYNSGLIPILKAYEKALERYIKAHTAVIESAVPLSTAQQKAVVASVVPNNRGITIETQENRALIGGVKITVGDTIYEDSVDNKFAQIKEGV